MILQKAREDRPCRLPAETDASTPRHLRDKYAIVGVGETNYTRGSGKTTRALGTWAVRNAIKDAARALGCRRYDCTISRATPPSAPSCAATSAPPQFIGTCSARFLHGSPEASPSA